jgi:lipocalin
LSDHQIGKYLWILARESSMDVEQYSRAVAVAKANGFPVDSVVKTWHSPHALTDAISSKRLPTYR